MTNTIAVVTMRLLAGRPGDLGDLLAHLLRELAGTELCHLLFSAA